MKVERLARLRWTILFTVTTVLACGRSSNWAVDSGVFPHPPGAQPSADGPVEAGVSPPPMPGKPPVDAAVETRRDDLLGPPARDAADETRPAADGPSPGDSAPPSADAGPPPETAPPGPADAAADIPPGSGGLHPNTRLVAVSRRDIYELDRAGQVLQQRPIPGARDFGFLGVFGAAITGRALLHVVVDVLTATSTTAGILNLDLMSGQHEIVSVEGYRVGGLVGAFGVATAQGFVFAANDQDDPGFFRFDLAANLVRALPGPEDNRYSIDVTRGRDGRIYLLTSGLLLVGYDPNTLAMTGQVRLEYGPSGIPIRGVAVDADGKIYAAAERGQVLRYSPAGQLEQTIRVEPVYWFHDIELDSEGRLLAAGDRGELLITDRALAQRQLIELPDRDDFELVVVE